MKNIIVLLTLLSTLLCAQKIYIKNTNGQPVEKASVVVQINYAAMDYIFNAYKEKLITLVTDSTGVVELSGEFQKDEYEVKSIVIQVKHSSYMDYNITTLDYSTDPKFSYKVYLTPKNKEINVKSMPNLNVEKDMDIYSVEEVAKKLKIKEEDIVDIIERGELKGKKIGDKYYISWNELRKYLEK